MKSIKLFGLALVFLCAGNVLFAQENAKPQKTAEDRAEKWIAEAKTKLSLKDDQVSKVKEIMLTEINQRDIDKEKLKGNREQMQAARKEREVKAEADLKKILDEGQYKKYFEWKKELEQKEKEKRQSREVKK